MILRGTSYVFVYGSLKRGCRNTALLGESPLILESAVTAEPVFRLVNLGEYPGAIWGKYRIAGQLFEVDTAVLRDLDFVEQEGYVYNRIRTEVGRYRAWIYVLKDGFLERFKRLAPPNGGLIHTEGNTQRWEPR